MGLLGCIHWDVLPGSLLRRPAQMKVSDFQHLRFKMSAEDDSVVLVDEFLMTNILY